MDMETQNASARRKPKKAKKPPSPKTKTPKKKKTSDGPTCSMFLSELTRKLAYKKKQEDESPKNIVHTIIDSITNALPVIFSKKSIEVKEPPVQIETLQEMAPELIPNDMLEVPNTQIVLEPTSPENVKRPRKGFKMPKMPLVSSDQIKPHHEKTQPMMTDAAVNTGGDHDVASEIAKHVGTLKKISLIAEEFHQKTAKNLKEIVDSVQEDLIKKLEQIQAEQKLKQMQKERPSTQVVEIKEMEVE